MLISRIFSSLWILFISVYFFFTDSILGVILLVFTAILALFLYLNLRLLSNQLSFKLKSEGTVHKQEAGEVLLQVTNQSWFPVARLQIKLAVKNKLTETKEEVTTYISVSGKSNETLALDLISEYAGVLEVSLEEVVYFDFLGVFTREVKQIKGISSLYILPEIFSVSIDLAQSSAGFSDSHIHEASRKGKDGLEIFGIKEYSPEDSLKNVHWKLTSKFDELIVKELSEAVNYSFLILLDLTSQEKNNQPAVIDSLLDSFVSVSKGLLEIGYAHSIAWLDKETDYLHIEEVFSEDHLTSLLRQVLSVRLVQSETSILERFSYVSESYSHVIQLITDAQTNIITELGQTQLKTIIQTEEVIDDRINVQYASPETKREALSHLIL